MLSADEQDAAEAKLWAAEIRAAFHAKPEDVVYEGDEGGQWYVDSHGVTYRVEGTPGRPLSFLVVP